MSRVFLPHVITDDSALGGSEIERSLRFNSEDSTYLQRSVSSNTSGSSQKITISFWIKIAGSNSEGIPTGTNGGTFFGTSGDNHRGQFFNQEFYFGNANYWLNTAAIIRDASSWYHVVYVVDTTQGTASNRQKIYVNGVLQDRGDTINDPSQNATFDYFNNSSQTYYIGRRQSGNYFNGYLAEIHFTDGYAYDASYFGFTEQQTGIWKPKKVTGVTYGTNGFHLEFKDNSSTSALGKDTSGNGHNFTTNNFGVGTGINNDSVEDTPTNNWATLNPLHWNVLKGAGGTSNGSDFTQANLRFVSPSSVTSPYQRSTGSTIEVSSGKWYYEVTVESTDNGVNIGFAESDALDSNGNWTGMWIYNYWDQERKIAGSAASYGARASNGDIVGVAFDLDNDTMEFFLNNSSQGKVTSLGISGKTVVAAFTIAFWTNKIVVNFGQQGFAYTPPAGFKALCAKNLPPNVPSIVRPQRHFDTILYTGDGQNNRKITGLEFKPGLVWLKQRAQSGGGEIDGNHGWYDSVRGVTKRLKSNSTGTEDTFPIGSFDDGGFTFATETYYNDNNDTFVGWFWKAGDATVTNNDGSGTSQVSANQEAGFSIVTYSGNATGSATSAVWQTIGHGLGKTPKWIIFKARDGSESHHAWAVYHHSVTDANTDYLKLNTIDARIQTDVNYMGSTLPTSSVFSLGYNYTTNESGKNYVAYCWCEVPGYSKFGKYTGSGSTDGTFVYLGFRPAWLMVKRTSSTDSWLITDNKRDIDNPATQTQAPQSHREDNVNTGDNYSIDYLSNGFKCRGSGGDLNGSGQTYIYMAFAEQPVTTPFDTSTNAR